MERRERFRKTMANLRSTGEPRKALQNGLVVRPKNRTPAQEIATRLELDPQSSHLLLGGVGSGKTTELLLVHEQLMNVADLAPLLIDVSEWHDLTTLESGSLLVMAGCAIAKRVPSNEAAVVTAANSFGKWAYGGRRWASAEVHYDSDDDYEPGEWVSFSGMFSPPGSSEQAPVAEMREALRALVTAIRDNEQPLPILLFDSLDRIFDENRFLALIQQDLEALKSLAIGCVLIGPITALYEERKLVLDRFDKWHLQRWADPRSDDGLKFLTDVLAKRADPDVIPLEIQPPSQFFPAALCAISSHWRTPAWKRHIWMERML